MIDQAIFRAFRDRHQHAHVLAVGTLAGLATVILLSKEPLKGSAFFLAYKICLLIMRARRLAQIKQEIAEHLNNNGFNLLNSDDQHKLQSLLFLDKFRNLGFINTVITQVMRDHQLTFQQIERFLRQNNCYTYLIARKRNWAHSTHLRFVCPLSHEEKKYHLFISTRNQEEALSELLEESSSYQENLDKLKDTGVMQMQEHFPLADHFQGGAIVLPTGEVIQVNEDQ
ncbi:MAG: hypothetical protein JSS10_03895 [Verrucomicrobia bacterium]|nr:hypothetical protein [Verrucomicrobiota bacterium]